MRAFDDSVLLLVGANFSTKILDDGVRRHSKCIGDIIQVRYIGLHSVEARLLLQYHFGHGIPKDRVDLV